MPKTKKKNNFEDDLARLKDISSMLEDNEIGLDNAIALYEEGIKLSKNCIKKLEDAQLKITELKKDLSEVSSDK
jgi:exodeoxyribonuclease VII small subunit